MFVNVKNILYLCTIIKIRDMGEDNTQYFNDEWNIPLSHKKVIKDLQLEYNKNMENLSRSLLERTGNMKFSEIGKEIKIIKQIKNKDANKYTK